MLHSRTFLDHQRREYWTQFINEPWPQQPPLRARPIVTALIEE
jgi:hypothetical protein